MEVAVEAEAAAVRETEAEVEAVAEAVAVAAREVQEVEAGRAARRDLPHPSSMAALPLRHRTAASPSGTMC